MRRMVWVALLVVAAAGVQTAHASPAVQELPPLVIEATGVITGLDPEDLTKPPVAGDSYKTINDAPALLPLGDTTVTWLVIHDDGRYEAYKQVVTVTDTTSPWFIDEAQPVTKESSDELTPVRFDIPRARDLVDLDVEVTSSHEPGSRFPAGITNVTFTATDDSGNYATLGMQVTITDLLTNLRLERTSSMIRAMWDPVPGDPSYKVSLMRGGKVLDTGRTTATSYVFPDLEPDTRYVVSMNVHGDRSTTVKKATATLPLASPEHRLIPPVDIKIEATAPLTPVHFGWATVPDSWDPAPIISNDAPAAFPVGKTVVTWTATDGTNTVNATQVVKIIDTTKPVFVDPPESSTYTAVYKQGVWLNIATPTAMDAADPDVEVKVKGLPPLRKYFGGEEIKFYIELPRFPIGNTTVTFIAKDDSDNVARHAIVITVNPHPDGLTKYPGRNYVPPIGGSEPDPDYLSDLNVTTIVIMSRWDPRLENGTSAPPVIAIDKSNWVHVIGEPYEAPVGTCTDGVGRLWLAEVDLSLLDTEVVGLYPIKYTCTASGHTSVEVMFVDVIEAANP